MKKFLVLFIVLISTQVFAQLNTLSSDPISAFSSDEDFNYTNYYKVKISPDAEKINLMDFENITEQFPVPAVPYNRDTHFGGWLRDSTDGTCLNTRGKVLVRDSSGPVKYAQGGCTVNSGNWDDPYTGRPHKLAKDIQIDHVVALKNAYMTGAHEWNFAKRCLYANYMGNKFHLLSVDGPENLKKSDHSPAGYVPPNRNFSCSFIKTWLNIKLIWSLRITPKESDAIKKIYTDNHCSPESFEVPAADLNAQHQFMEEHADLCHAAGVQLTSF